MLSVPIFGSTRAHVRGFSLIEMMIAIVIGLVVIAGAISLIVAIDKANSETIQSTRLTQELRSLASVVADDIKRARYINDPIGMVGTGVCATAPVTPAQPCYPITPTAGSASCVTYGYTGTISSASVYSYRSVRLVTTSGIGAVNLAQLTFDPNAVAAGTSLPTTAVATACPITGGTETQISSREINVTGLTFTYVNAGEIDLSVTGQLLGGDSYTNAISRTFTQPIFIRSSQL
ncbi:MAG: PilW family protein [Rudaea sp.]